MGMSFVPDAEELNTWGRGRRNATQSLGRFYAQSGFDRQNAQIAQRFDRRNLAMQYKQMRDKIPGSFVGRGLLNSGLYGQALQDYGTQKTQAYGALGRKYQQMFGQNRINTQNAEQDYANQMGDIANSEQTRRQQLAAQIRGY